MTPPGAVIAGYRIHLTAETGHGPPLWWTHPEAGIADGSGVGIPPVTAGCPVADCVFGDEGDPLADENLVTAGGAPGPGLVLVARCGPRALWIP